MPWVCHKCSTDIQDDHTACPTCSAVKTSWTIVADLTRAFVVSRPKIHVKRGEGSEPTSASQQHPVSLIDTDYAPLVSKATARGWLEADQVPPSGAVLFVQANPAGKKGQSVHLDVEFARAEPAEVEVALADLEPDEGGWHTAQYLLVFGKGGTEDLRFPQLMVVDVTEDTSRGFAPEVEVRGLDRDVDELPLLPLKSIALDLEVVDDRGVPPSHGVYELVSGTKVVAQGEIPPSGLVRESVLVPAQGDDPHVVLTRLRWWGPGTPKPDDDDPIKGSVLARFEDLTFNLNSIVLLPDAREDPEAIPGHERITGLAVLEATFRFLREQPQKHLLVVGHTDTTGKKSFNLELSQKRAETVRQVLSGDRQGWAEACAAWSYKVDWKQILAWADRTFGFDCNPGVIDENATAEASAARDRFRAQYAAQPFGRPIPEGEQNQGDWAAYFDLYEAHLAERLGVGREELAAMCERIKWVEPAVLGCGERWPTENPGKDEFLSRANRRVELWFLDPDELPDLPGSPAGVDLYGPNSRYDPTYLPVEGEKPKGGFELILVDEDHLPIQGVTAVLSQGGQAFMEAKPDARGTCWPVPPDPNGDVKLEVPGYGCWVIYGGAPGAPDPLEGFHLDDEDDLATTTIHDLHPVSVLLEALGAAKVLLLRPAKPDDEPDDPIVEPDDPDPDDPDEPDDVDPPAPEDPASFRFEDLHDWRYSKELKKHIRMSAGEFKLKQETYKAAMNPKGKGPWTAGLNSSERSKVGGSNKTMRKNAAAKVNELFAEARSQMADGTTKLGVASGYRPVNEQFKYWNNRWFPYYTGYCEKVLKVSPPDASLVDPKKLAHYIGGKTAAPGFSDHQRGIAIDFSMVVNGKRLGSSNHGAWKDTWFHDWLQANAHRFGFKPLSTERWHWNYKP